MENYEGEERRKQAPLESVADLEAMLHRAARHGARDALREIGLNDPGAGDDVRELRAWMSNIRLIKLGFRETTIRIFTAAFWLLLLGGVIAYLRGDVK